MPLVKLTDFNPQAASITSLREPMPEISHLLRFGFKPEYFEKFVKVSIKYLTDLKSRRRNVESSA